MKEEERKAAMNPARFRKIGSQEFIDLRTLDETDDEVYNCVYYKEYPLVTGDMDETLIVTYSPKYAAYQRNIREKQIERAQKMIGSPRKKRKGKNPNDPMRFVKQTTVTNDGEIEENFRIMKEELGSRHAFVRREDRIKGEYEKKSVN